MNDACVEWGGWRDKDGYGRTKNWQGVHRRAWERANGAIPAGLFVLHRCDNPACINVDHLWLGTATDNNRDREAKGRSARNLPSQQGESQQGEKNPRALLTEGQVRDIRELHQREGRRLRGRPRVGITRSEIAARYGVSVPTIDAVLSGRNWPESREEVMPVFQSNRRSESFAQAGQ